MSASRSSRVRVEARFFFEPGDLCRQASDFGIQFLKFAFVGRLQQSRRAFFIGKELRQSLEGLRFPFADLVRVHLVLGADLGNRLFFF